MPRRRRAVPQNLNEFCKSYIDPWGPAGLSRYLARRRTANRPGSGSFFFRLSAQGILGDVAILADVLKTDTDPFRDSGLLHRNPVQRRSRRHRLLRMGYDDKLRPIQKTLQHVDEPPDVRFVERCIHLVQHTEGTRPELEDRHQQAHGRQCFFPTA